MRPLQPGSSLASHYIVGAEIGEGGMGVVYQARDERLGRDVALKVLPPDALASHDALQRFTQEARTASNLNHPNIVTIYEIGQDGDVRFMAEELVVGRTLRACLGDRRLTLDEAIDIGSQVAGALGAAHAAGVVHRDIKPENVMIRADGLVKVLDFGLAKVAQVTADAVTVARDVHTKTGVVVGTVSYMSPEQGRGLAVDARSDVFSLGVVLYEMIAGRRPFTGPTSTDVLVAILQHDPPALGDAAPGTPAELSRIVGKALRKSPDERYQSVKDLLVDLKAERATPMQSAASSSPPPAARGQVRPKRPVAIAIAVGGIGLAGIVAVMMWRTGIGRQAALTEKDTILVTDFANRTGEATFDGSMLRQALLVQLQQTPFLNLFSDQAVATTLAMMEKTPDEPVTGDVAREICQRQHLAAMVTGAIARLGQHYVMTIEATDPQSGRSIAIEQGEAPDAEHVLQVLGTTATGIRRKLGETIGTLEKYNTPIEQATTSSLEALKAYTEALRFLQHEDGRALPFFLRAIELDPNFVAAYDNGAWALVLTGNPVKANEFASEGYMRRDRATQLEQYSVTATYHHFVTGNLEEEIRIADVWARLFPNDYTPYTVYTLDYPAIGRLADSVDAARTIIRLNPNVAQGYRFLTTALVPLQRYDDAQQSIAQAKARGLDNVFVRRATLQIAVARGDQTGIEPALDALRQNDGPGEETAWRARMALSQGRWRSAQELFLRSQPTPVPGAQAVLPVEAVIGQALLGLCQRQEAASVLALSRVVTVSVMAAVINPDGTVCGDPAAADAFAAELARKFPESTIAREVSLPQLRAAVALSRNRPEAALEALRSIRTEGTADSYRSYYLRGRAYLKLGRSREAAADFQFILDHRGWAPTAVMLAVARLGQAQALAQAGDTAGAAKSYEQLLTAWKDADPDLPVLVAARAEAAKLRP